jgi:6-phosphogluconolactonase/glucosamine-6-phosphate isomerase/deaminase
MRFVKITNAEEVARYLADAITRQLEAGERVLWLVPGGSSIDIAVAVSKLLSVTNLTNLTVSLTDERYGVVGHADSNWHQLQTAGFTLPHARLVPVLEGDTREHTTQTYASQLQAALQDCTYRLGFFGIGADGHTAGILPGTPAVDAEELAASYDAGSFERITMTEQAIRLLDEAVVYARGEAKWPIVDALAEKDLPYEEQPAQLLKLVPKLTVFNDHRGDTT